MIVAGIKLCFFVLILASKPPTTPAALVDSPRASLTRQYAPAATDCCAERAAYAATPTDLWLWASEASLVCLKWLKQRLDHAACCLPEGN